MAVVAAAGTGSSVRVGCSAAFFRGGSSFLEDCAFEQGAQPDRASRAWKSRMQSLTCSSSQRFLTRATAFSFSSVRILASSSSEYLQLL